MSQPHLEELADRIKPRAASSLLLWGIIAFAVIFFAWAALTKLERVVSGIGRVIPSSQLQVVSNLEGGVVQNILVRIGDQVKAGQELVRLDPTQSGAEFGSGAASVMALDIKIARLEAEVAGRTPSYPVSADAITTDQVQTERSLYASRVAELASATGAAQARLSQAERTVAEAESAYQARREAADARGVEVATLQRLVDRGIEPRMSLTQAISAAAVARSEAAAASAAIARGHAAVAEARSSLSQLRYTWRSQSATELATAQAELATRQRTQPALVARVERTTIRSPLAGRINRVLVTTRGAAVQPGQPLVEIVPSQENLLIEARVRPQDIGTVRIGQAARVGITAYDPSVFGRMDGKVVSISPDAVRDEHTGETYYQVIVRTNSSELRNENGRALPIGPGMIANVSLRGDERTVLQYLLTPLTRLSETALRE
jgi:adhesin transport system membrane fusion protein